MRETALRAVELDPLLADAHALLAPSSTATTGIGLLRTSHFGGRSSSIRTTLAVMRTVPSSSRRWDGSPRRVAATARAVELEPLSGTLRSSHGRQLYRARRYDEAIAVYQRALEVDPTSTSALQRLADVFIQIGRYADAQALLDRYDELYDVVGNKTRGRLMPRAGWMRR